jgi:peptidyl-tRNA hydrolase, PTH1 family
MKIIAGLGNPGPKYELTRHNVGFLAIDRLIERWHATGPNSKFQGELYNTTFKGEAVCLVKPQTFMNLSGKCIGPLFQFYHCSPDDLIVIHDELDLNPMTLRLKTGGGTGGHNGLKSIDEVLGKEKNGYHRVRIGIGHPSKMERTAKMSPANYVLLPLEDTELKALDPLLDDVSAAIEEVLQGNIQSAMNKYHRS